MSTVNDAIQLVRDTMIEWDIAFAVDAEFFRRVNVEEALMLLDIVGVGNPNVVLPDDANQSTTISTWAESYTPATAVYLVRTSRLVLATGEKRKIQYAKHSFAHGPPVIEPSMYWEGGDFYPIDGVTDGAAASRIYGWVGAASVSLDYIPRPAAKAALTDNLSVPEEALDWLASLLAVWAATRGKAADATVQQIRARTERKKSEALGLVDVSPGPNLY